MFTTDYTDYTDYEDVKKEICAICVICGKHLFVSFVVYVCAFPATSFFYHKIKR